MALENTVNQRILDFIKENKNGNKRQFSLATCISTSNLNNIVKGKSTPGFQVLYNIAIAFPDIDLKWLITGKEDEQSQHVEKPKSNHSIDYKEKFLKAASLNIDLQNEVKMLKNEINMLKGSLI